MRAFNATLPEDVELWRVVTEAGDALVIRVAESHHDPANQLCQYCQFFESVSKVF